MIFQIPVVQRKDFTFLFSGQTDTLIQSCLQGFHGSLWCDHPKSPSCGRIICGDFCFLGGDASSPGAKELICDLIYPFGQKILIFIPPSKEWQALLTESWGNKLTFSSRYRLKKEPEVFDRKKLSDIVSSLSKEYRLKQIDSQLYKAVFSEEWSRDFVSNFSPESFSLLGLGFVVLKGGVPVSGASSYIRYRDGIEIEIDTRESERRKGLAAICAAALILECLERDLYPSWDAANPISLRLAQKLGYHLEKEYPAFTLSLE